jgi:GT2 family glycosyltransferase
VTQLSAIVPATNRPATLERCLAALQVASADEVVVVREPAGAGPALARNAGAARAAGELLVFVDADVVVHADALDRVRRAFAAQHDLVAVFGSYDDAVATRRLVAGYRNLQHHVIHQRCAGPVASFWAGLGAVRATAFNAVGGFDAARYPSPSIEDIELGGRLARLGSIRLDPGLRGTHLKEWSLREMVVTDFARRGVPWVRLMLERRSVPRTLNLGMRERASAAAALACVVGVARRRPAVVAAGATAQVVLNRDLYAALRRGLGKRGVAAGLGLHTVHQLTAAAAVPAGVAAHAATALSARR